MAAIQSIRVPDRIAQILSREIQTPGKTGRRLDSVRAMAKRFSVSTTTIGQVMAILNQQGLIQRRHGSGIYIAERRDSQYVGILSELDITSPGVSFFFPRVIQQFKRFFDGQNLKAKIYVGEQTSANPVKAPCREFLGDLKEGLLGGLAVLFAQPDSKWIPLLRKKQIPVIGPPPFSEYEVRSDTEEMIRMGLRFFIEKGRKRIAVMGWSSGKNWPEKTAFEKLMNDAGLKIHENWLCHDLHHGPANAGMEEFGKLWRSEKEKPDALLVCDDLLFRNAAMSLLSLRINVPEDLLVVSHSNKGSGIAAPFPVQYLELDPDEYAYACGETLLQLLNKTPPEKKIRTVPYRWAPPLSFSNQKS
ncbi:MAG: LacI family DNA-binding transcriptional regulator [Verrucomicrobiae bacterium]|nr:LacI family DNA-binding transcriptional regulator [Verrucomicrobiae bacterium]